VRSGEVWYGSALLGEVRHSSEVGQGKVVQGGARFGMVGRGKVRLSSKVR